MSVPQPSDPRLVAVDLDEATIDWRSAEVEQERRVAIFDLLEQNHFRPLRPLPGGYSGPFRLLVGLQDGRLVLTTSADGGERLETLILALGRFRRPIKDYFAICDSYYQAIRQATPAQIETIDMARRGLHNQAAELLIERLEDKIEIDFETARRLFTLICALHARG